MYNHDLSRVIPLEKAEEFAVKTARAAGLSNKDSLILDLMVKAVPKIEVDGTFVARLDDVYGFLSNLDRAIREHDSAFLLLKRGLCVDKIVDIEEFVESADYLNQKGYVRPAIRRKLLELFAPGNEYIEAVLTGAIGIGKNYFADCALAYMVYVLSCFHNPQLEFDLAPGSSIVFIQQSVTLTLARKVLYDQFAERIRRSKYFKQRFRFDPEVKSELRFPKGVTILPVGGSDTSALGMNVFGGVIDEMNFMARTRDSALVRYTAEDEYDQAERLYSTLIRRIKSRFMQKGKVPGKLLLVSSTNYPGDFTDRKVEEAKHDTTIFVMKYSQWEALPADRFCGEKFLVEVGNDFKRSQVIPTMEAAVDKDDVIEVPIEYKTEFDRDIDAALRDLGGIAAGSKSPFIPYRELIGKAMDHFETIVGGRQLFKLDEVVLQNLFSSDEDPDWSLLVDETYFDRCMAVSETPFAAHIDVGLTTDAAGLAIGRIVGYKMLAESKIFDESCGSFVEVRDIRVPIYQIDGVLRIVAPANDEVDLGLVRDLILYLRGKLPLHYATSDSYQSAMLIQAFRKARIRSGVLSVDTSSAPYTEVKLAIKDERIWLPRHSVLARELREVEKDKKKDKVDHPPGGSKDVSDAVAGVVYILQKKEASYGRPARRIARSGSSDGRRIRKIHFGTKRRLKG